MTLEQDIRKLRGELNLLKDKVQFGRPAGATTRSSAWNGGLNKRRPLETDSDSSEGIREQIGGSTSSRRREDSSDDAETKLFQSRKFYDVFRNRSGARFRKITASQVLDQRQQPYVARGDGNKSKRKPWSDEEHSDRAGRRPREADGARTMPQRKPSSVAQLSRPGTTANAAGVYADAVSKRFVSPPRGAGPKQRANKSPTTRPQRQVYEDDEAPLDPGVLRNRESGSEEGLRIVARRDPEGTGAKRSYPAGPQASTRQRNYVKSALDCGSRSNSRRGAGPHAGTASPTTLMRHIRENFSLARGESAKSLDDSGRYDRQVSFSRLLDLEEDEGARADFEVGLSPIRSDRDHERQNGAGTGNNYRKQQLQPRSVTLRRPSANRLQLPLTASSRGAGSLATRGSAVTGTSRAAAGGKGNAARGHSTEAAGVQGGGPPTFEPPRRPRMSNSKKTNQDTPYRSRKPTSSPFLFMPEYSRNLDPSGFANNRSHQPGGHHGAQVHDFNAFHAHGGERKAAGGADRRDPERMHEYVAAKERLVDNRKRLKRTRSTAAPSSSKGFAPPSRSSTLASNSQSAAAAALGSSGTHDNNVGGDVREQRMWGTDIRTARSTEPTLQQRTRLYDAHRQAAVENPRQVSIQGLQLKPDGRSPTSMTFTTRREDARKDKMKNKAIALRNNAAAKARHAEAARNRNVQARTNSSGDVNLNSTGKTLEPRGKRNPLDLSSVMRRQTAPATVLKRVVSPQLADPKIVSEHAHFSRPSSVEAKKHLTMEGEHYFQRRGVPRYSYIQAGDEAKTKAESPTNAILRKPSPRKSSRSRSAGAGGRGGSYAARASRSSGSRSRSSSPRRRPSFSLPGGRGTRPRSSASVNYRRYSYGRRDRNGGTMPRTPGSSLWMGSGLPPGEPAGYGVKSMSAYASPLDDGGQDAQDFYDTFYGGRKPFPGASGGGPASGNGNRGSRGGSRSRSPSRSPRAGGGGGGRSSRSNRSKLEYPAMNPPPSTRPPGMIEPPMSWVAPKAVEEARGLRRAVNILRQENATLRRFINSNFQVTSNPRKDPARIV